MLTATKINTDIIYRGLNNPSSGILTQFILYELLKYLPTPEELEKCKLVEPEKIPQLPLADQFICTVANISFYDKKVKASLYYVTFSETFEEINSSISSLHNASTQVVNSSKFKQILNVY